MTITHDIKLMALNAAIALRPDRLNIGAIDLTATIAERRRKALRLDEMDKVYVVRVGRAIKVGHSTDIPTRLAAIQVHHPTPVKLLRVLHGGYLAEQTLHHKLASAHLHGEWFNASAASKILKGLRWAKDSVHCRCSWCAGALDCEALQVIEARNMQLPQVYDGPFEPVGNDDVRHLAFGFTMQELQSHTSWMRQRIPSSAMNHVWPMAYSHDEMDAISAAAIMLLPGDVADRVCVAWLHAAGMFKAKA